jgi:hypothetical protein
LKKLSVEPINDVTLPLSNPVMNVRVGRPDGHVPPPADATTPAVREFPPPETTEDAPGWIMDADAEVVPAAVVESSSALEVPWTCPATVSTPEIDLRDPVRVACPVRLVSCCWVMLASALYRSWVSESQEENPATPLVTPEPGVTVTEPREMLPVP